MKFNNWSEFNELLEQGMEQPRREKRQRQKQRKWREIEEFKERQRMRRELVEYNECDLDRELQSIFA